LGPHKSTSADRLQGSEQLTQKEISPELHREKVILWVELLSIQLTTRDEVLVKGSESFTISKITVESSQL
jgi:hypothetical protein